MINAAFLFKIAWTFFYDVEDADAQAPPQAVVIGMVLVNVVLVAAARWLARARAADGSRRRRGTGDRGEPYTAVVPPAGARGSD